MTQPDYGAPGMGADVAYPVRGLGGITTEHAAGAIVIGSLIVLIAIRRGFRGVRLPGIGSVGVG